MNTTLKAVFVSGVLAVTALGAAGTAGASIQDPLPPVTENGAASLADAPLGTTLGDPLANGLSNGVDPGGATNGVSPPPNGLPAAAALPDLSDSDGLPALPNNLDD
ncbi:hypothetical protein [Streptomyces alboniger]|uniref:ATP-binding protein n=1 Tax=Streptomyces alboniger TaxID=132473 RepID=A0A5J6HJ27_STRAD|nr:hypothetical protein [Streptomyces alboniger]QEV19252.1 hypothetical protein CP975_18660 [Streptomyces alboniger]